MAEEKKAMGEQFPLVTAVICTYKRAQLVPRAIKSVQEQTYRNIEIIVVDDASPDDTQGVISRIEDPRVRYIRHETNEGLPAGRNTGIRAAKGEYVAFLDDDDEWYPKKIECQIAMMRCPGVDAVLSSSEGTSGHVRRFARTRVTADDLRRGNEFAPGSGLMAKASVLRELQFDELLGHGEDWDLLVRLVLRGCQIAYIAEVLYRVNDGGHHRMTTASRNLVPQGLEKRMRVIYKHREFLGDRWFRIHAARVVLSHFLYRKRKLAQVAYAVRRFGVMPVISVLADKVARRVATGIAQRIPWGGA
jgi:glycosyltransferase involved in cell wall biosynthesis